MLIRQTELEVPASDPFRDDALGRKELEPPLTQLVTQALGSFVLALDGSFGSGKTTFLRMWQVKLTETGHVCLYLNAWKNDFTQDPLVAVVGELSGAIKDVAPLGKQGTSLRRYMKKTQQVAESIAKRAVPVGVKLATLGIIDTQDLAEKVISEFTSDIVEDQIKGYEKGKSEIEEFRKSLTNLTTEVAKLNLEMSAKVVLIIDELDRCRPTYAVQLLERMKHLFDVPGVVFILGIDRTQLHHSIRALYGSGFNAFGYLKRFIDLDYYLPEPKVGNYSSFLFKRFNIEELVLRRNAQNTRDELTNLKNYLGYLMSASRMSLREQEQMIARLRIVLQTISAREYLLEIPLCILLFLREWDHNVYTSLLEGSMSIEVVLTKIENLPGMKEASNVYSEISDDYIFEAYLIAGARELNLKSTQVDRYEAFINKSELIESESEKFNRIHGIIAYISRLGGSGFKTTAKRLALTNNFVPYDNTGS